MKSVTSHMHRYMMKGTAWSTT